MFEAEDKRYFSDRDDMEPVLHGAHEEHRPGGGGGSWKIVLAVLVVVCAALAALAYYASRWKQEVVVRKVVIEGTEVAPKDDISALLDGSLGKRLDAINVESLRARLLRIPFVREVSLNRELSGILRVRIVEREPLARTTFQGSAMVIDTKGVLLPELRTLGARFPGMIRIYGIGRVFRDTGTGLRKLSAKDSVLVMELTSALRESEYARLLIREIHLEAGELVYCKAAGSPSRFILGSEGNFKEKLKKFEIFWQQVVSKKGLGHFHTVDLRFRDRIFARDSVAPEIQQQTPL